MTFIHAERLSLRPTLFDGGPVDDRQPVVDPTAASRLDALLAVEFDEEPVVDEEFGDQTRSLTSQQRDEEDMAKPTSPPSVPPAFRLLGRRLRTNLVAATPQDDSAPGFLNTCTRALDRTEEEELIEARRCQAVAVDREWIERDGQSTVADWRSDHLKLTRVNAKTLRVIEGGSRKNSKTRRGIRKSDALRLRKRELAAMNGHPGPSHPIERKSVFIKYVRPALSPIMRPNIHAGRGGFSNSRGGRGTMRGGVSVRGSFRGGSSQDGHHSNRGG